MSRQANAAFPAATKSAGTSPAACHACARRPRISSSFHCLATGLTSTTILVAFLVQEVGERLATAQLGQAACATRPDSAYWNSKGLAYLGVGHRRFLHEQQQQLTARERQLAEGDEQRPVPLSLDDLFFDHSRRRKRGRHLIGQPLAPALKALIYAQQPQAFPLGGGCQPAGKGVRFADRRQPFNQPEPYVLRHVVDVCALQRVTTADRPHQRREALNELLPRVLVALRSAGD